MKELEILKDEMHEIDLKLSIKKLEILLFILNQSNITSFKYTRNIHKYFDGGHYTTYTLDKVNGGSLLGDSSCFDFFYTEEYDDELLQSFCIEHGVKEDFVIELAQAVESLGSFIECFPSFSVYKADIEARMQRCKQEIDGLKNEI